MPAVSAFPTPLGDVTKLFVTWGCGVVLTPGALRLVII